MLSPFVYLVCGWGMMAAAVGAVLLAFKGAEYADDHRWPWWAPAAAGCLLAVLAVCQGLNFLGA